MLFNIKQRIYNHLGWSKNQKIFDIIINCSTMKVFRMFTKVASIDETIDKLIDSECSMSRFGDGEFKVIFNWGNCFQSANQNLSERLAEILKCDSDDSIIICIPNIDEIFNINDKNGKIFYKGFIRENGFNLTKLMNFGGRYYSTNVTRFYLGMRDKRIAKYYFERLKEVWKEKDVLFVEGKDSKLGVENDLFDGTKSIKRIIAPSQNAFDSYEDIITIVKERWNGELVLIALGQTATVLAYDLHKIGIRALDIGHIDIEYMWCKIGAKERVRIRGKHTAELDDTEMGEISNLAMQKYLSEIIFDITKNSISQ